MMVADPHYTLWNWGKVLMTETIDIYTLDSLNIEGKISLIKMDMEECFYNLIVRNKYIGFCYYKVCK
jgi:hypothetical protein